MSENLKPNETENTKQEPEILVNEYDNAVVIDAEKQTVLLTEQETIVIEKDPIISIAPKNRPRKVYGGMWGVPEITTVGLAGLAILAVLLLYVFFVLPKQKELSDNRAKRDELEQKLASAKKNYGSITTTEKRVAELITSVNDFETRYLRPSSIGQSAIYQQINGLIAGYGLVNTTGPDYTPLGINLQSNNGQQAEKESGRAKFQSLFPGDYVTMTVEGNYQSLRRFIREIETSNQFIVISAVELEPSETEEKKKEQNQTVAQQQQQPQNPNNPAIPIASTPKPKIPQGKNRGEIVSLRLEMAVYYRRPNFVPMEIKEQ